MSNRPSIAELFEGPVREGGRPPVAQQALYEALKGMGDVPFHVLLSAAQGTPVSPTERDVQQRLGMYVTRLNRRIKKAKLAVRPGKLKGTYRLEHL